MMEYEYYITHSANGLLDVDDIGNCAIDLFNDVGREMVMVIDTDTMAANLKLPLGVLLGDVDTILYIMK